MSHTKFDENENGMTVTYRQDMDTDRNGFRLVKRNDGKIFLESYQYRESDTGKTERFNYTLFEFADIVQLKPLKIFLDKTIPKE